MKTRIKICGITRIEDAVLAGELGVDAIGLNLFKGPRQITCEKALPIINALPPMVTPVGLVEHIDRAHDAMTSAVEAQQRLAIRTFQTYAQGEQYGLPAHLNDRLDWWPVMSVGSRTTIAGLQRLIRSFTSRPQGIVLDTMVAGQLGGTGKSFDWQWLADARAAGELDGLPPIILAGGLTPENVADAIRIARPYAVDVSSGVENKGQPGIKDPAKLRDFIQAAHAA